MAFSMLAWSRVAKRVTSLFSSGIATIAGSGKFCCWLWLLLGPLVWLGTASADFRILDANTYLDRGVYRLNAKVDWQLSQATVDALQNGVPLILKLRMEVLRRRDWLWDEPLAGINQRFRLEYHALARQYVVTNLNSGELKSFPSRPAALGFMGQLRDFPLLDRSLLAAGETYYVRLRATLEIDALPAPLRPFAYLSGDWQLSSEWYLCPI